MPTGPQMSSPPGQSAEKRMRAIDRLDQHMIKRSKSNNRSSSPVPFLSWITQKLPPPSSLLGQREALVQTSPSPKRRKMGSPSPSKTMEPPIACEGTFPDEGRCVTSVNSSPIKKTVAFSDKLESSPTQESPRSSPRPTSISKPAKSILRKNADAVRKTASDLTFKTSEMMHSSRASTKNLEHNARGGVDPRSLDYWIGGEVHSMVDSNSIHEFRSIIEGGLDILSKVEELYVAKRFEVYATFNNIMPVITGKGTTDISEKKITILIDHMEMIVDVCLLHLESEQEKLLSTNSKKDPFVSRLYVQIVRFLNSILSNFKIIKWLTNKPQLQSKFKAIYRFSIDAITHNNTNKVIVAAQVAFLGDVKFDTYFLNDEEITGIIHTIPTIKEIQSTNLICEKLILIKNLLAKYPKLMIENVSIWLCGEVLPRILIDNDMSCSKIVLTAVSTTLDLLKKCLDFSKGHEDIYNSVEICTVRDVVPSKLLPKLLPSQNDPDSILEQSLGQLLRKQLKYLIVVKGDYKLAMDLWLAMTGLLYNSTDRLRQLTSTAEDEWLSLNLLCFQMDDPQAKLLSIKVWRILTYSICTHLEKFSPENLEVIKLLQKPFIFSQKEQYDFNVMEGLLFHLTGIIYTAFCGANLLSTEKFNFFWEHLVSPIYMEKIFASQSIQLKVKTNALLLRLLGGKVLEQQHKQVNRKNVHPIKVIASAGVNSRDIQALPPNVIRTSYETIKTLIFKAIESDSSNLHQNCELITALLKQLPSKLADKDHFMEFTNAIFSIANERKDGQNIADMFTQVTCCLATQFASLLFNERKTLEEYLGKFGFILLANGEAKVKLLKELIVVMRGKVSEFFIIEAFLQQGDLPTKEYVSNWIGSMLLSPAMPQEHFCSLVNIVNLLKTSEVLENFLILSSKVTYDVDLFSLLNVNNWEFQQLICFIKNSIAKNHNTIKPELEFFLQSILPRSMPIFLELLPFFCEAKHHNIIRNTLAKSPTLLNSTSSVDKEFFDKILPLEKLPFFLQTLSDYQVTVELRIILWSMEHNQINMLFGHFDTLERCLFKKKYSAEHVSQRNELIEGLLSALLVGEKWLYLSRLIELCMKNELSAFVTSLFSKDKLEPLFWLTPMALGSMANKCGFLNSSLIETIKKCFSIKPVDFIVELTKGLIHYDKYQVFFLCGKEVVAFFTKRPKSFSLGEQNATVLLFQTVITSLMHQKESLILDLVETLYESLPQSSDGYHIKISAILAKQLRMSETNFKKQCRYDRILKRLLLLLSNLGDKVENADDKDENLSESQLSDAYCIMEEELSNLGSFRNTERRSRESADIQVYATQMKNTQVKETRSIPTQRLEEVADITCAGKLSVKNGKKDSAVPGVINSGLRNLESRASDERQPEVCVKSTKAQESPSKKPSEIQQAENNNIRSPSREEKILVPYNSKSLIENQPDNSVAINCSSRSDDFAPVNVAAKDEFLDKMEKKLQTKTQKALQEIRTAEDQENPDVSLTSQIRFPIFNSSKFHSNSDSEGLRNGRDKQNLRGLETESGAERTKDNELKNSQRSEPESSQDESTYLQTDTKDDWTSKEPTPSLRLHFPSKKSRKLVSRLRGFTVEDVSKISPEEKRNLRIELLDFMMKLEHESLSGEF